MALPFRLVAWLLLPCLLAALAPVRAWDADRMREAARKLGPRAVEAVVVLQPMLQQMAAYDEPKRLLAVNEFFNQRIRFQDDLETWGAVDHWASPLESLNQGIGDCEDYAIAKYFVLVAAGTPAAKLRLVYVRAQLAGVAQAHMVLAYYASSTAEPLILDNLVAEVRPASQRPDLAPVFSFNSAGLWQGTGQQSAGDPLARLSRWREVLAKARAEGLL